MKNILSGNCIDDIFNEIHQIQNIIDSEFENALSLTYDVEIMHKDEESKIPYYINVISSAAHGKLRETAHSRILVDLLRNHKIRKNFIDFFFNDFELSSSNTDYIPPPDNCRIDATIKCKDYCIIIENKVNGAVEQRGQIYRYVQEVNNEYDIKDIYVLYLNPSTNDIPSEFSLTKNGEGKISIKDELGNRLVCRSYKYTVIEWLRSIRNKIKDDASQPYLQSAIVQYLDYLETFFQTSNIFKPMNTKIENLLIQKLDLNSLENINMRVEKINETIDDVEFLLEKLEILKENEVWEQWNSLFKEQYGEYLQSQGKVLEERNIGFDFMFKNEKMRCCIQEDENTPFWGIYQYNENAKQATLKYFSFIVVENTDLACRQSTSWPVWNWTDLDNGFSDFSKLADAIIAESKKENSNIFIK